MAPLSVRLGARPAPATAIWTWLLLLVLLLALAIHAARNRIDHDWATLAIDLPWAGLALALVGLALRPLRARWPQRGGDPRRGPPGSSPPSASARIREALELFNIRYAIVRDSLLEVHARLQAAPGVTLRERLPGEFLVYELPVSPGYLIGARGRWPSTTTAWTCGSTSR